MKNKNGPKRADGTPVPKLYLITYTELCCSEEALTLITSFFIIRPIPIRLNPNNGDITFIVAKIFNLSLYTHYEHSGQKYKAS